jgi:ADP-heptose:LPS heptosyltransferase
MPQKGKLIILRFSAMGDVAMVASVLREFASQHPATELVMVSRVAFKPFFDDIPNVTFHAILPKTTHKGIGGLYRLYQELMSYRPIAVADLHDNLRSRMLSSFFRLSLLTIKRIDKGRAEKRALTRPHDKVLKPLKPTVERYADVFRRFGFNLNLSHKLIRNQKEIPVKAMELFQDRSMPIIGISPFAQHHYKLYPLPKMEIVIRELDKLGYQVFIFGGGEQEQEIAHKWEIAVNNVQNLIGRFTLSEELAIISNLELMVSMDSSGMHMASLMGIPVLSVWGPTHPYAGFLGYGQQLEDCIQVDHSARPSSIYGNKPCLCGSVPCIELVEPNVIVHKIKEKVTHG